MQKSILKNIIIATLPIFAYIVADYFFQDSIISVTIAIGISVIEFIINFIIYKKFDLFILFDVFLISLMGIISILLKNPIFFKLKPAIIEVILLIFMIPLCFSQSFFVRLFNQILERLQT